MQTAFDAYDFIGAATAFGGATIASYACNFGDSSAATGPAASHRYSVSGTFPVVLTVLDSKGTSETATKSVTATGSTQPTFSGRVHVSREDTNWLNASTVLRASWVKGGGDWFDKNGVFNGPTPTISVPIRSNAPLFVDISGIEGDLLLTGIYGWDNPMIDGQPAVGFHLNSSSNQAWALPAYWGDPGMILNPARGKMLTLTPNANPLGQTLRIDKVAGPVINDYPTYVGPSNTPNVWELEMTDYPSIVARAGGQGNIAGGSIGEFAYDYRFSQESYGLKYLRFAGTPGRTRLISWFLPIPVLTTMHERFCIYIEDDVADGMVELGVKLPGFSNDNTNPAQPDLIAWRLEHGAKSLPNNRGVYALVDYLYDAESGPGFPAQKSMGGAILRTGRWYVIEQAIRLNTAGVSDGYGEIWLNGTSVWRSDTIRFRNNAASKITMVHVNVYHGGMTPPKTSIHYRIAKIGVSSTYIGVPKELLTDPAAPALRKSVSTR